MRVLDRLYELETRKRELPAEDPEFVRLAREVQDVATSLLSQSQRQEQLADDVSDRAKRGDPTLREHAIEDVPPGPREATIILAEWRAAERRLAAARPSSNEERDARRDVDRLRAEYSKTINLRGDEGLSHL